MALTARLGTQAPEVLPQKEGSPASEPALCASEGASRSARTAGHSAHLSPHGSESRWDRPLGLSDGSVATAWPGSHWGSDSPSPYETAPPQGPTPCGGSRRDGESENLGCGRHLALPPSCLHAPAQLARPQRPCIRPCWNGPLTPSSQHDPDKPPDPSRVSAAA